MGIELKGANELKRKLNNLSNLEVLEMVKEATLIVHGQAKILAPVDTGNLRNSIHMSIDETDENATGKVFTNCEYAVYQEFRNRQKRNAKQNK